MLKIEVTQAQESLPRLIEAAAHGEEVIITQAAAPVAQLIAAPSNGHATFSEPVEDFAAGLPPSPLVKNGRLVYGSAAGKIIMSDDFDAPLPEFAEYCP